MTKLLTYVEIDIDFCANVFGVSPCTATGAGDAKCFNSIKTCQDRVNFSNSPVTLRFAKDCGYLPADIPAIPSITGVDYQPVQISLGKDLGTRAAVTVLFKDHPWADSGAGYDPYRTGRSYNPWERGSYWGKFRARQPFLRGRALRLIRGTLGQTIDEMTAHHFLIEDFNGPTPQGQFTITAKDILKLADGDRAQAPFLSNGYLGGVLAAGAGAFTIQPTGIGNEEYPPSGYIAIGGEEICSFSRAGDNFTIARGQLGTTDVQHEADDRVQACLIYAAENPASIIGDLLVNYAGIPDKYFNFENWQTEVNAYLQRLYSVCVADPVDISTLVSELVEQAALALWWSDTEELVKLRVLRNQVNTQVFSDNNIIENSLQVSEQPDKLVTEIWTYYGMRNPLEPVDDPANYRSTLATVDLQTETDLGSSAIKKIFSRWIPAYGSDIAARVNAIQLSRYKSPPRLFQFKTFQFGDITPVLGNGYNLEARVLQDATGDIEATPIQIVRLSENEGEYSIEAEENLTAVIEDVDLTHRTITIDSNTLNVNLKTIHDTLYPAITVLESPTIFVTCIINTGVIVGSSNVGAPAFDVGAFPAGVVIRLLINGRIQGAGGKGGDAAGGAAQNGLDGGTALYTRTDITIDADSAGGIWGGGAGGGGGSGYVPAGPASYYVWASGGGGGQGYLPGNGGLHYEGTSGFAGDGYAGTTEDYGRQGGYIAPGVPGGDGGAAGAGGVAGTGWQPGAGGTGGHAVDGESYITYEGGTPSLDSIGTRVN